MTKLSRPLSFETTFGVYELSELLGEGGAGRVYGGFDPDGSPIALKLLARDRVSTDKRKRFKNEIAFLSKNRHANVVTVIDHGISVVDGQSVPFYVMKRYDSTLRHLVSSGISRDQVLSYFSQILDGVEAAHLQGVIHRDLKPENVLHHGTEGVLAVADFGVASFTDDLVATLVDTSPAQRLANFKYAAPEQRETGGEIQVAADIYALGLILNEMFTRTIALGTDFPKIEGVAPTYGFLDSIVEQMLRQSPTQRPVSIREVKHLIQRHRSEAVSLQRLSEIKGRVIKATDVDEPLADVPPVLTGAEWNAGLLTLFLDRPVNGQWINALRNMGSFSALAGKDPRAFIFHGNTATVSAVENEIQQIIDYFKGWLPVASETLKSILEREAIGKDRAEKFALLQQLRAEEERLRINKRIQI